MHKVAGVELFESPRIVVVIQCFCWGDISAGIEEDPDFSMDTVPNRFNLRETRN
jgi:hypothetical protein